MVGIGCVVVISLVASSTGVRCVGVASAVAAVAIIGDGGMCAKQRMNGIMVKAGRHPRILRMALRTVSRELSRNMVRIARVVIVRQVASRAGVWSVRVIPIDVTAVAIVGNARMRPMQRINGVMVEDGWFP